MKSEHRWAALGVLAAGLAMIVLDGTIVGVALPVIIDDLHLSLSGAEWVNAIYAVVFAALLMSFGRLGDAVGRRALFVVGVAIFTAGSVLGARSGDGSALIVARAVQGLGGAMVLPSSLSTVNATFRGKDRAAAFGLWGAVMAGTAAIGPLLGGWFTTSFAWQWIFWVNVPIGVAVIVGASVLVRETRDSGSGGFDFLGVVLSSLGFGALVFAIIEGPSLGWWSQESTFWVSSWTWPRGWPVSPVPVALAAGLVLLVAFVATQQARLRSGKPAILNLDLLRIPTFSWGNATAIAVAVGEFALVFVVPLYLVSVLGLTTMGAGWVLAGMALGAFASGAMARHLSARLGAPRVVVLGLGLEVAGVAATALLMSPTAAPWALTLTLAVYGVGLGLASAQLTSTVLADVPTEQSGQGSATQSTARQIGSALGTALSGSALAAGLAWFLPKTLEATGVLPEVSINGITEATKKSVGGYITSFRTEVAAGVHGPDGSKVLDAVTAGFTQAAQLALWAAVAFLLVGLAGSLRVAAVASRKHRYPKPHFQSTSES